MPSVVRVLEQDPELGQELSGDRLNAARRACLADLILVPRGSWQPEQGPESARHGFGLLVLSGLLTRRVGRDGRFGAELLGSGDLLRPWDQPAAISNIMPFSAEWKVMRPVRLALLDRRFATRTAPYPEIAEEIIRRTLLRSRQLAMTMAIVHNPRVEVRVELLLWVLAERWATVRPDGVALSLPLTHALLADLVAARRPTVSAALSSLSKRGRLRRDGDLWVLTERPPGELEDLQLTTAPHTS